MGDHGADILVVTGASSGIGAEIADIAAARGARVVLLARHHDALAKVAADLTPHDAGPHFAISCDVTQPDQVEQAIAQVCQEAGIPTALVNCAGVCKPALLGEMGLPEWQETMDANVTGTFLPTRAIVTRLQNAGMAGSILNIGSEASFLGMPGYSVYCTSKAALTGLTKSLAAELAPHIRVNLLCPGPVDTPMLRAEWVGTGDADAARESEIGRIPVGRVGFAREIAEAAVWLLWDAVYATGSIVPLDGGTTGAFMAATS